MINYMYMYDTAVSFPPRQSSLAVFQNHTTLVDNVVNMSRLKRIKCTWVCGGGDITTMKYYPPPFPCTWLIDGLMFFVPLENLSLIWRRYHCRWRAEHFELYSALIAIEQWGFFYVPHLLWHGSSVFKVISEDSWHSHPMSSVWQWNCNYLF